MKHKLRCPICGRFVPLSTTKYSGYVCQCGAISRLGKMKEPELTSLRLPLVTFQYPPSTTGAPKQRYLRVTKAGGQYVEGIELTHSWATEGQFKRFKVNRLLTLPILAEYLPHGQ